MEQTPPRPDPPWDQTPPGKQTAAYAQRADGTHPTGMHSCLIEFATRKVRPVDTHVSKLQIRQLQYLIYMLQHLTCNLMRSSLQKSKFATFNAMIRKYGRKFYEIPWNLCSRIH